MDTVIREINDSLLNIINDLEKRQLANQNDLDTVNVKINEKVDEAKDYKNEVDDAKSKIKTLENEIEGFELDLSDLNERFGKKDLTAVLEAGNREINSKIMEKQNQITRHRQKIGELTDRARSIKDLLVNLKKDKVTKEEKLEITTKAYDYYNESLTKIIDFAKNNPKSLNTYDVSYNNLNYDYSDEPLSKVFEEIESMDIDTETTEVVSEPINKIDDTLSEYEEESLNNIFEKINKNVNFDEINKSIDQEYENIFGNSNEIKVEDNNFEFSEEDFIINTEESTNIFDVEETLEEELKNIDDSKLEISDNVFDIEDTELEFNKNIFQVEEPTLVEETSEDLEIPDIFGNNLIEEEVQEKPSVEIIETFKEFDLDFNKFNIKDQELIKNIFSKDHFQKVLGILRNNQLDLNKVYNSVNILEKISPEELDQIITKLLLADQTKYNIELVLNSLENVTSNHLTEVINSYGQNIKDADITDIIIKTKKLSGDIDFTKKPTYLTSIDFTEDEITILESTINRDIWEKIINFPELILVNYQLLKDIGVGNVKEIFNGHPQMFVMDPDRFKAIFAKYDQADLIRCLEKNAAVIEEL